MNLFQNKTKTDSSKVKPMRVLFFQGEKLQYKLKMDTYLHRIARTLLQRKGIGVTSTRVFTVTMGSMGFHGFHEFGLN